MDRSSPSEETTSPPASDFIRDIIRADVQAGKNGGRVVTRFPPEPNGYLHIGHAKSICLNFGVAQEFGGVCHMRFDDTNPEKEDTEYVESILESVRWLGFDWGDKLFYASDYFGKLYDFAIELIKRGKAYVCELSAEETRRYRGTLTEPGKDSPYRDRPIEENLRLFAEMRAGKHAEGSMVLRAKIDMASPNINLRDPAIYRIKHARHHNTGDRWCIYPMYSYAHPIEDALEQITHSICTLEFEDQRPFYEWTLERIVPILRAPQFARAKAMVEAIAAQGVEAGKEFALHCHNHAHKLFASEPEGRMRALFRRWEHDRDAVLRDLPRFFGLLREQPEQFTPLLAAALDERHPNVFQLPHQHEFGRLNLTSVMTSKRKLKALVDEGIVSGWDDPRMPTLAGLRRRGYTPASIRKMAADTGASKTNIWIDYSVLEIALRDDLEGQAARAMAVLDPLPLELTNWAEVFGSADHREPCQAPAHPQQPGMGLRRFELGPRLWIERDDFAEVPEKGFFRLYPGNRVRLKYGVVVECTGCRKNAAGDVTSVQATVVPDTKSGTPGADAVKVKGTITWLSAHDAVAAELRLFERLFVTDQPEEGGRDFRANLNPHSARVVQGWVEPSAATVAPDAKLQFERHGYFVADRIDHAAGRPVFNRITTLKDARGK
jgi:glutaminyl-tRNA synthetase